ncbi:MULTISPECIES: glycosyltransferase [unclassified Kitasatospora]|uniref:glycosyltransferase n=1 Tax=unclassified Kitasatospora TaxID=2633591 RepID=UPI000B1D06C4|nr:MULTISPECIES: glycosyltransferase [unclassified Kitasatospora]
MIPCRDEEAVVGQTLAGLRRSSPEAHLWVVDDDSQDRTRELMGGARRDRRRRRARPRHPCPGQRATGSAPGPSGRCWRTASPASNSGSPVTG